MKIIIDEEFLIDVDELNHTLKQKYKAKGRDGQEKEAEKVIGYFPDIEQCIERYIDVHQKLLTPDKAVTLRKYVILVKRSNKETVKAIKKMLEEREM